MARAFVLMTVPAILLATAASAADYYVATDGNDAWSGSQASPNAEKSDGAFATLHRARDAVRAVRKARPAEALTVHVRAGLYSLSEPLRLGQPGALPDDWTWQMRPTVSQAAWVASDAAEGQRALRMTGGLGKEKNGRDFYPQVVSRESATKPGQSYRLSAKLKADKAGARASLMLQSYVANVYFWGSSPNELTAGTEWTDCEFVFRLPAPGERTYNEQMKQFRVRIDFREPAGTLWVDDVRLQEVEMLDEWASWQSLGFDQHSVVADPLFVDADHDDYRLKPESPALKLGVFPIPVERIGPYQDELRTTWPIIEAEGAREKPLTP